MIVNYPPTASRAPIVTWDAVRHWPERSSPASPVPGLAHWMLGPMSESDVPDKLPLDKLPLPHPANSVNTIAASRGRSRGCLVIDVRMFNLSVSLGFCFIRDELEVNRSGLCRQHRSGRGRSAVAQRAVQAHSGI